jgi:hypothetical protein
MGVIYSMIYEPDVSSIDTIYETKIVCVENDLDLNDSICIIDKINLIHEPVIEPINKPINKPINEPINEPITEPINKPIIEPINEPVIEPINEPVIEPINEPVIEPINEPVIEPINEPVIEPINEPVIEAILKPFNSNLSYNKFGNPNINQSYKRIKLVNKQLTPSSLNKSLLYSKNKNHKN